MSAATSGAAFPSNAEPVIGKRIPGCRCAHPGYELHTQEKGPDEGANLVSEASMMMVEMVVMMPGTRAGDRGSGNGEDEKSRKNVGKRLHEHFLEVTGCNAVSVGAARWTSNT